MRLSLQSLLGMHAGASQRLEPADLVELIAQHLDATQPEGSGDDWLPVTSLQAWPALAQVLHEASTAALAARQADVAGARCAGCLH